MRGAVGSAARSIRARPFPWLCLQAAVLAFSACTRPAAPPPAEELRIAHEGPVITLDPVRVEEDATHSVVSNVYESLVAFDKDMRFVPALAVSWTSLDERTWSIQLRKGVRCHGGGLLTAHDVKHTLDRGRTDTASGVRSQLATVESVEALDDTTLRIRTLRPDPLLVNRLTYVQISTRRGPAGAADAGTGPYQVVSWTPGATLEVRAFPGYWRGPPPIERVRFVTIEEGEKGIEALARGEVHTCCASCRDISWNGCEAPRAFARCGATA